MIIENEYGRVNFEIDFTKYKKIGMSFSGGCDSTLLFFFLFLLFEHQRPDSEIIPVTGINVKKGKWKLFKSQEILDFYKQKFPTVTPKIKERIINYNSSRKEYSNFLSNLSKKNIIDIRLFALTKNPPTEIMQQYNLIDDRELSRDEYVDYEEIFVLNPRDSLCPVYDVFRNVDKRWIAQCYKDYGLMNFVYPLTVSCERFRNDHHMIHNEEPCKHCWWCREKKMAFGTYDGGVL